MRPPPIESGAFLVQDGHIRAVGARGAVQAPAGATRVDLTGKTVMPAMVNVHVHIGYEGYTTWQASNHTPANVLDHLQREAFYGVAATTSVGTSPTDLMLQFQRDQRAGKFALASRLLFLPGMAPPNGGPDAVLRVATNELHVVNEVTSAAEARAAVRRMAAQGIQHVKMWVDDRGGTYPKLSTEVVPGHHRGGARAPDDRACARHSTGGPEGGRRALAPTCSCTWCSARSSTPSILAMLKEKKPYWATVIGLGDQTAFCDPDPFFEQALPDAVIAKIRATTERRPLAPSCGPPAATAPERERQMAINFPQMLAAGARVVLATDTGIQPGHTFGSGEHLELARWVQLGMSPAQAIVAATSRPAELMGQKDLGTLAIGKRASFIVLDGNPLENIKNTRRIADVYLDGAKVDREGLRAKFKRAH